MKAKYSQTETPRRPLRADFTSYTMRHAQVAKKRAELWRHNTSSDHLTTTKEDLRMKPIHKPIMALLGIAIAIGAGGTAYAAVGGLSSITALFGGSKPINSSTRIVTVDIKNCLDINALNITTESNRGNTSRYYEVKANAHLSDQQVVDLVQSVCRSSYSPAGEQAALKAVDNQPQNKDTLFGNAEGTVVAITNSSIDIKVNAQTTSSHQAFVEHITNIDPQLAVFDGNGMQTTLATIHVGDQVYSQYRAIDSTAHSEAPTLDQVDWSKQMLVTLFKQSPDAAAYDHFNQLVRDGLIKEVAK